MIESVLKVDSLSKSYGSFFALKNLNFDVFKNELLCVVGPSGSGKSTLLGIISGTETQSAGEIYLDGYPLSSLSPGKRDFGVVFQGLNLFPQLNVFDNIGFSLRTKRHKSEKQLIKDRVGLLINDFSLTGLEMRYPNELSGGEKQRVAIARALAFEPKLLLLDEPFSALDRFLKDKLITELKKLQVKLGLTVIYITHDQYEAASLSDRVLILNHGVVQQIGSYEDVYLNPQNKFVREFIGFNNQIKGTIENESDSSYVVKINDEFSLKVAKRNGVSIGDKIEIYIRPEELALVNDTNIDHINTVSGKVKKCIKADIMYKIFIELTNGIIWHFYNQSGNFCIDEILIVSFGVNQTIYFN